MIGLFNLFVAGWMISGYRRGDAVGACLICANLALGVCMITRALVAA